MYVEVVNAKSNCGSKQLSKMPPYSRQIRVARYTLVRLGKGKK
jgi:hypothetical protein